MADEKEKKDGSESEKGSGTSTGIFLILICLLLLFWRGDVLLEDVGLIATGEKTEAVMERKIGAKQRKGERERQLYYFVAEGDTIRNESTVFGPLMAMISSENENEERVFNVLYYTNDTEQNYPRITVWLSFMFSLIIVLIGLRFGYMSIAAFRGGK